MFEITGDDIANLSDTDLRILIGRLCEAGMRRRGLPTSAVTYSGSQDAKDGGLDVRVRLSDGVVIDGFVPKPQTGFQVKKPDMPRAAILDEMKPKPAGHLRPIILDLAAANGAYVIISSNGSTTDVALNSRRSAMAEAIKGTTAEGKLALDFYDRNRVATWVRDHPGLIPWVRERIGKAVPGWKSFGAWSHTPQGVDASYLTDEHARIRTGDKNDGGEVSAVEGINRLRKVLGTPGHVVRLVGLSGVGKTRLAEALFDTSIGEGALDPSLAIYTNESDEPNPPPAGLASDLIAEQTRAILVVDNCTPELHRKLSETARRAGSTISVISIEYDIREDQPEGTDVFTLETSSIELIEKLVGRHYPHLSQVDAHKVAEFSGGNARVALALASQIEKTEILAGLSEEDLFKRIFQQRHDPDPSLLSIAQACSLVYSFEGEKLDGDEAELPALGSLVGESAEEVYAGIAELKRRDLVQTRAQWRAVLPHAIANRLAKLALQNIPPMRVNSIMIVSGSERMLRSFSRRLGYLDDSKEAKAIVESWLAPGGLLSDVANFNELGRAMFTNIAPVAPEAVLSTLEATLSGANEDVLRHCMYFVRLLRALAYEPEFFERSLALLLKFAALSRDSNKDNEATEIVESLFYIVLSGTHAPIAMRIKAADALLASEEEALQHLGVKALEALMKTAHFSSHYGFEFGARSRDYGYYPRTGADTYGWFEAAVQLARKHALAGTPTAAEVQKTLARQFRGLWTNVGQSEVLEQLARDIAETSFWRDGWIAARQTRNYDGKALNPELRYRLTALEEFLRPKDLVSKIRGIVIGPRAGSLDFDDFDSDDKDGSDAITNFAARAARHAAALRTLGHDVAADENSFKAVLHELARGGPRVFPFGEALAEVAENLRTMWDSIVVQMAATENASLHLLGGFLRGLQNRDAALADTLLEEAVEDLTLAAWFPALQSNAEIDERALARLHRALELGNANITSYVNLAYGRASEHIPGPEFRDLVLAIARKPGGSSVALEILSMRFHLDHDGKRETAPEVREAGRLVLDAFEFHGRDGRRMREDHELGVVAKACLAGPEGAKVVSGLCQRLIAALDRHEISGHDADDLMKALLTVHPLEVLDALFPGDRDSQQTGVRLINSILRFNKTILKEVPDDVFFIWCEHDPAVRFPLIASVALIFQRPAQGESYEWTPLAVKLLQKAPEPLLVLNEIVYRLHPMSWSGSLATKLEERLKLLDKLPGGDAPLLAGAVAEARARLQERIAAERRSEQEEDRARNNRFE